MPLPPSIASRLRLPLIAVVGALFYAEPLDPYVIFGAGVIFAGIWLNIRSEIRPKGHTDTITNP